MIKDLSFLRKPTTTSNNMINLSESRSNLVKSKGINNQISVEKVKTNENDENNSFTYLDNNCISNRISKYGLKRPPIIYSNLSTFVNNTSNSNQKVEKKGGFLGFLSKSSTNFKNDKKLDIKISNSKRSSLQDFSNDSFNISNLGTLSNYYVNKLNKINDTNDVYLPFLKPPFWFSIIDKYLEENIDDYIYHANSKDDKSGHEVTVFVFKNNVYITKLLDCSKEFPNENPVIYKIRYMMMFFKEFQIEESLNIPNHMVLQFYENDMKDKYEM